jgi:hypothetical protein
MTAIIVAFCLGLGVEFISLVERRLETRWKIQALVIKQQLQEEQINESGNSVANTGDGDVESGRSNRFWGIFRRKNNRSHEVNGSSSSTSGTNNHESSDEESDHQTAAATDPLLGNQGDVGVSLKDRISQKAKEIAEEIHREAGKRSIRSAVRALWSLNLVAVILLIATFNMILCGSVVTGLVLGAFLFGGWIV